MGIDGFGEKGGRVYGINKFCFEGSDSYKFLGYSLKGEWIWEYG